MPISLQPLENDHVLLYTISGRWTVDELIALFPEEAAYRNSVAHKVHVIVDIRDIKNIPANLPSVRYQALYEHPTAGRVVLVGVPPVGRVLVTTIYRLVGFLNYSFKDSVDEALAELKNTILAEAEH